MNEVVKQAVATDGFFVAAFGIDGRLEGLGRWEAKSLSPKWTQICGDLLRAKGAGFEHHWTGTLSHVRTKFTSAHGAAIGTFSVNDEVASSWLLLHGRDAAAERDVAAQFVDSLRRMDLVRRSAEGVSQPFADALLLSERPLMVVVPFPFETVADQDYDLIRELSLHLAIAYFVSDRPSDQ